MKSCLFLVLALSAAALVGARLIQDEGEQKGHLFAPASLRQRQAQCMLFWNRMYSPYASVSLLGSHAAPQGKQPCSPRTDLQSSQSLRVAQPAYRTTASRFICSIYINRSCIALTLALNSPLCFSSAILSRACRSDRPIPQPAALQLSQRILPNRLRQGKRWMHC